ncbi:helix-turn-helix domain-containing protein [Paenibacillus sp. HN-1]|uniref:RodZ domain-containing protein n=1 Tax=Paenibacillus TaxID=44249 RepID=UPI001CA8E4FE|nr:MULTISPECIES: RodZ domain-containing protein [Paenibacillus]MBY9081954.1 helix-turn-helix domain-containing protein [Paenibacillus sp. CGMCC 1.18879]MBY9085888.1 helix-turn-helix domain-containing protein [Paenibacillus sinensis]
MSELGRQLKEARLQKGMSLDDVQEVTKIRKKYLEAIEAGDYKVLPGSFYVRAFIKTYAEAVGLNPDELMQEPGSVPAPVQESSTMESVLQSRSRRPESGRNPKWLPTLLMWIFPVLIVVVIYMYASDWGKSNDKQTDVSPITTSTQVPSPATASAGAGGGATPSPSAGAAGESALPSGEASPSPSPSVSPSPAAGSGTVVQDGKSGKTTIFKVSGANPQVVITATGKSWLEVYRGTNSQGEKLSYGSTESGNTLNFTLDSQGMYIKSGYSPATQITVNGQTVTDGKSTSRILLKLDDGSAAGGADTAGGTGTTGTQDNGTSTGQ